MMAPGMRAKVARSAKPVTRGKYFPNLFIFDSPFFPAQTRVRVSGATGSQYPVCRVMSAKSPALFPANRAVNRLRAEMAARRHSEHQCYVRKSDLGSSRYANR